MGGWWTIGKNCPWILSPAGMAGTPLSRGPPKALLGHVPGPEGPPGAVRHVVDDRRPAPPVGGVGQAAVDGEGVVQHALPGLQPDGHRVELGQLLGGQDALDRLQVLEVEVEDGEGRAVPGPSMGAGDVLARFDLTQVNLGQGHETLKT